jgi:hypothetical protein
LSPQAILKNPGAEILYHSNPFCHVLSQLSDPRWPRLVLQPTRRALFHEPRLREPDGGLADTGCAHDCQGTQPVGRGQHDPRASKVFLGAVAVVNDQLKALAIGWVQADGDASAHLEDSRTGKLVGIPQRTLMLASIH